MKCIVMISALCRQKIRNGFSSTLQKGFTLVELLLIMGIMATLLSIATLSFFNTRTTTVLSTSFDTFITDLKNQQTQAMVGDTEGRGVPDAYGIYIQPTKYTLFHGENYNPSDPANFDLNAETGFTLSTTFPENKIVFATNSGEIIGYTPGQNAVILTEIASGQSKTLQLNKLGTVTNID
jgi:prepilin-type N-terminal cleavage/methylation domain-containing protein